MKEVIHSYGAENNLNGIATIPDNINKSAAVILFNAGVLHKVNAFDLNIDIKKALSNNGALIFRFDFNGMGDSEKSSQKLSQADQNISDITDTMNLIENKYNISEFILIGLCTGADNAHKFSVVDERVKGVVWLDGYAYPTHKYKLLNLKRHIKAALNPKKLTRFIKKKFLSLATNSNDHIIEDNEDVYVWKLPDKNIYLSQINDVVNRGCQSLYLYSGGVNDYYLYQNQFFDSFKGEKFLNNIEVEYYPQSDHLYALRKHREMLLSRLSTWLNKHFIKG